MNYRSVGTDRQAALWPGQTLVLRSSPGRREESKSGMTELCIHSMLF